MELTEKLLKELQKRLKVGNRRGIHLNAIPAKSRYKFDLYRLSHIDKKLPKNFVQSLLSELPLKFKISWKDNVADLNSLFEEDQLQLVRITKSFENLINQTETIELEKGINTFGFGFPLLIRRDQLDNKLTVSPILIWSLRIKRTKEFNTWEINRNENDPIYLNEVLINHLQNDSNIEIEPIPSEMLDDGIISNDELIEICFNLIKAINSFVPEDLANTFRTKLDNITSISEKSHYEKLPLNSTNAYIDFCGLFSIFEVQKQNIINEYGNLMDIKGLEINLDDMEGYSFQPISSVETDPSQQSILHSLETSRNILIQGPPGTGKSQTLTAILINALENQKRTIVVCEKRTALEVLHNALKDKGLSNQCVLIRDIIKDRKTVVDSVRARIDNSGYRSYYYKYSKETLNNLISKANTLINSINQKHKKLDEKLLSDKSWTDIVGTLLTEIRGVTEDIKLNLGKINYDYSSQELNTILDKVNKGEILYKEFEPYESLTFINLDKILMGDNPFLIERSLEESFSIYIQRLGIIKESECNYKQEYFDIRKAQFNHQLEDYNTITISIKDIYEAIKKNPDFLDEKKYRGLIYKITSFFSKEKKKFIEDINHLDILFKKLHIHTSKHNDLPVFKFSDSLKINISKLVEYCLFVQEISAQFSHKIEQEYYKLDILNIGVEFKTKSLELLIEEANTLKEIINNDKWASQNLKISDINLFINEVECIIKRKQQYFSNENDLLTREFKWYKFYYDLNDGNKKLINELKSKSNWSKVFLIHYLNSMLISKASNDLPTHDNEQIELQTTLSGIGNEQLKYIRAHWYSNQISATSEFEKIHGNISVENLYNKRSSNRYKRLSLRQIVQYDSSLFTTFFPIIMTSPDVCCNLFKGMNGYFDIVMFDEASQLRLEDNLPAILKGKQIIISGDEHQMPPSNYFSKVFDGSIEDEDDIDEDEEIVIDRDNLLLSCESLLDFGVELNFEKKYLDFHYRSKHPYLIDFSNFAFYNQRLRPLPNDFEYIPIKYVQVNGTFSDYTNDIEAEMVLSILENNINRLPNGEYPTVGVATFNISQRNLIKSKILERQKFSKFDEFNAKIQELEENGMFIKNLENIQGDEKDVIILSTTYGIGKDGKFAQRFGPINHTKGYKLLNVIITRAKYKVYVCSSVPEKVFMNYKDFLTLEGANNRRAVFYAYLAYSKAISENNNDLRLSVLSALNENTSGSANYYTPNGEELESPFEEEVYQTLVDEFGEFKLIPQYQYAGFRIDIVYDSKNPSKPKIAIECDGAKFHSSREAYLYDWHRQKILENHGFVFHRIWSTNWWRNPKKESAILIEFIKNIDSEHRLSVKDYSRTALAFTDEILDIEDYVSDLSDVVIQEDAIKIQAIEKETTTSPKILKPEVVLNCIVKVKYINNGKDMNIQIIETTNNQYESTHGIQKINYKSALAVSILGHSVGDILKVGNLDNYVEILEIVN